MQKGVFKWVSGALLSALAIHGAWAGEITVSAASSLTNAFKALAQAYEARHPDAKVLLNFGASGALLQQIVKGAPVDVLAAADQDTMAQAQQQGVVAPQAARNFARNQLVLIVPTAGQIPLHTLLDLNAPAVRKIAVGQPASVPVGRYTQRALVASQQWSGLQPKMIFTQNVRQSLDYVARGEVDAGFVYATDALIMKDKVSVAFTVPLDTTVSYPIAPITGGLHLPEAQRFIGFVLSTEGQGILARYGFVQP